MFAFQKEQKSLQFRKDAFQAAHIHSTTHLRAPIPWFFIQSTNRFIKLNWKRSLFPPFQSTRESYQTLFFFSFILPQQSVEKKVYGINCIYRAPVFTGLTVIITLGMQFPMQLQWIFWVCVCENALEFFRDTDQNERASNEAYQNGCECIEIHTLAYVEFVNENAL